MRHSSFQAVSPVGLCIDAVTAEPDHLLIIAQPVAPDAACPECDRRSGQVHSQYSRRLMDLPSHGRIVHLRVQVRRFRCGNTGCPRRIFGEPLADSIASKAARRTSRLESIVHHLGIALGGRPAASLARRLMLPVSRDTLLWVVRRRASPPGAGVVQVVGIADFAWKRGQRYGTVMCDLEQRRILDLLLAVSLPVGYRRRRDGAVVQDPDDAVRLAVTMVFERFAALGNARAVLRHFADNGLRLPRVIQAGPDKDQAVWVRPAYGMIHRMLNNPAYAGAFVYGRCRQEVAAGDPPTMIERRLPPEAWAIVVQGVYPAYIDYNTFLANRLKLAANRYNFAVKGRCAARTGAALLQGLVHCGRCGRQMGVSYGRQQPRYECRYAPMLFTLGGQSCKPSA